MATNNNIPLLHRKEWPQLLPNRVHGTVGMYKRHSCRCEECVNAKREYSREYKRRAKLGFVTKRTARHGTIYMYRVHKCRCEPCRSKNSEYTKNYRAKHWPKELAKRRYSKYGIDIVSYDELLDSQNGKCGICQEVEPTCVDHNHVTGEVRGLLCGHCNKAIGFLKDNPIIAELALKYLKEKN